MKPSHTLIDELNTQVGDIVERLYWLMVAFGLWYIVPHPISEIIFCMWNCNHHKRFLLSHGIDSRNEDNFMKSRTRVYHLQMSHALSSFQLLLHCMIWQRSTISQTHGGWFPSINCWDFGGFIMSTLLPFNTNSFYFSMCSVNSIKDNIK